MLARTVGAGKGAVPATALLTALVVHAETACPEVLSRDLASFKVSCQQ